MNAPTRYLLQTIVILASKVALLLPVKPGRIVCHSYNAVSQYADSPMYIAEYLLREYGKDCEIIWLSENPAKFDYLKERGIVAIKKRSLKDFYYSNTACAYISNLFGTPSYVLKRKGRLVIETTHGVAYKSLISGVFDEAKGKKAYKWQKAFFSRSINRCDLCLSGSKITSETVYRDELDYKGEILEKGLPRNDVFFGDMTEVRESVRSRLNLDPDTKIAVVMPTWRKDQNTANIALDYRALVEALSRSYGGRWKVLLRLHPLTTADRSGILDEYEDYIVDVTTGFESQEVMCASDLLITDYSSVIWDFALLGRPILLFQPDLGEYEEERGFNVPPSEWGLPAAKTSEELVRLVEEIPYDMLCNMAKGHLSRFGSYETGHATEAVCDILRPYIVGGEVE